MKITPNGRSPETASEKLFAAYLDAHKYHGWLFEPNIEGCARHPDFMVPFDQQPLLFDVKERRRKGGERTFAWIDPMAGIREEIEEARRKFKMLKSFSCSLVMYNAGDIDTLLEPTYVFGAMLGDPGFTPVFDCASSSLVPGTARNVFLQQRGKMMRYKTAEMQNTTINAIIILEETRLSNPEFERAIDKAIRATEAHVGGTLADDDRGKIAIAQWLERPPKPRKVIRVRVCEHPGARMPLPGSLFCGPFDERWAIVDGMLTRTYAGARVPQIASFNARRPQ